MHAALQPIEGLEPFAEEWASLVERSSTRGPAASFAWMSTWWEVFGDGGRRLFVVRVHHDGRLVGLAFFVLRQLRVFNVLPIERLELLGSGEAEADEICSEYLGVLAESGQEEEVASAVIGCVAAAFPDADELLLPAMNGDDPGLRGIERALAREGFGVERNTDVGAPYIPLPSSFEGYLAALPSADRYRVRRSLRDFDRWAGKTAKLHWVATPEQLATGMKILEELHAERWQGGGVFASERFHTFHQRVAPRLLACGELQLGWLEAHGAPVAAIYNVVTRGGVSFYQCGRALSVPRQIRIGVVLHLYAVQRSIEQGLKEYDFLAGSARYKRELSTAVRPIVALRAARPTIREQAYQLARKTREVAARAHRAMVARFAEPSLDPAE